MRFGKCAECKKYKHLGETKYCQNCEDIITYDIVIPDPSDNQTLNRETEKIGCVRFRSSELSDIKNSTNKWVDKHNVNTVEFIDDVNKLFIDKFYASSITNQKENREIHKIIINTYLKHLDDNYYVDYVD